MADQDAPTLTSPDRLRKIDQLREKNVGTHMPLPQLVVVGDQSSGKSSLLESLTGIPFPNGQGLCTRYATQITHRRDTLQEVVVSIIPGPDASDAHKEDVASYRRRVGSTAELQGEFASILGEVNARMGIKTPENPDGSHTFSRDVLRIEKCGPAEDYLTVIDVPGIFRNTEEGVTTETDKVLVLDMVKSYIEQERTIILAVLPCTVDIMTQEILNLSEQYDKSGERTLGVLTKPDLLVERSTKTVVCDLVNGKKRPLNLGYYVVRNRGADEECSVGGGGGGGGMRFREKMFREEPWCHLPRDRVGVVALRERLQDLLGHITDKAFPKLRAEAKRMFAECKRALDDLGVSRQTQQDQQMYLCDVAARFQKIVRGALEANYSSVPEIEGDSLRLITDVVNITDKFNCDFIRNSNAYRFEGEEQPSGCIEVTCPCVSVPEPKPLRDGPSQFPELDAIVDMDGPEGAPPGERQDIMAWISQMYVRSRGVEVGTFGSGLLSGAFREQSRNWEPMVKSYLSKIVLVIHHFIVTILRKICTDAKVFEELKSAMSDDLLRRYRAAVDKALFLVGIEREAKPYTLSISFSSSLQGARSRRIVAPLMRECGDEDEEQKFFALGHIRRAIQERPNGQEISESIHDILRAYYRVARERVVDNLFRQAVDHCLLTGPMSPLGLFSEKWVLGLDTQDLASITGESRLVSHKREQLGRKMEDLESALKILR